MHRSFEFFRGRERKTSEDFKRDLEEYVVHWNTSRRQVRLKGLTPEEFRNQALAASSLFRASKIWDAVQNSSGPFLWHSI
ncbi:IS3 family transposase [Paratractidigestivibacter sp.]|uniref:IS3 family transposase n=1 Tax=Paratractidigestivibacter sp. TaxID=2847316 RepID=UPI003A93C223